MSEYRACDDNELQIDLYKAICKAYTRDARHLPDVLDEVSLRNVVLDITDGSDAIDRCVDRATAGLRAALAESEKDKAALVLTAAAMREQCVASLMDAAADADSRAHAASAERLYRKAAEIRALQADPTALSAKVDALVMAARRFIKAFKHVPNDDMKASYWVEVLDARGATAEAIQQVRDAGFGGEGS